MKNINIHRAERSRRHSRSAQYVNKLLIILVIVLALSACGSTAAPTPIPTLVLDDNGSSPNNNSQSGNGNSISASAMIVPVNVADLSFAAVGRVTEVNVKVGDGVSAGDVLVRLDTTILEARVWEAEANLLAAQVQLKYNKRLGLDEVHIESSEADVARMQALLDSANATLAAQSMLVAPMDGTVISVDIAPAETVVPGQIVIVLADLSHYQVETTDLSERDITRVQLRQPATIFIEALEEEFTGKVVDIDRIGSTLGGDVVFTVTIELDDQPQGLLWGMSADVQIQTAE